MRRGADRLVCLFEVLGILDLEHKIKLLEGEREKEKGGS